MSATVTPEGTMLVTIEQAARRLAIGRTHTYRLIKEGQLTSVRIGRSVRVSLSDIAEFIERHRKA